MADLNSSAAMSDRLRQENSEPTIRESMSSPHFAQAALQDDSALDSTQKYSLEKKKFIKMKSQQSQNCLATFKKLNGKRKIGSINDNQNKNYSSTTKISLL